MFTADICQSRLCTCCFDPNPFSLSSPAFLSFYFFSYKNPLLSGLFVTLVVFCRFTLLVFCSLQSFPVPTRRIRTSFASRDVEYTAFRS